MRNLLCIAAVFGLLLPGLPRALAQNAQDEQALIAQGKYLATAGDCSACHAEPSGKSAYGGGAPIVSPLGTIYASNITPDAAQGIGKWRFEQFAAAMRKGRSPDKGWLYPAMPYPAYAGMSDADLRALYEYLTKAVPASPNQPPETKLPFPFIRPAMIGWDLLFLHAQPGSGANAPAGSAERGAYVAESLEHCSTCHTPRGALFAERSGRLLSGAQLGGWFAPNITQDASGIGSWSDADITAFLTTGENAHAVAGGDMGLAVQRSLSHLSPDDIRAITAYLHGVPPVATAPAAPLHNPAPLDLAAAEPQLGNDFQKNIVANGNDGAVLYQSTCASCHGDNGQGSFDGMHPALPPNDTVRAAKPNNLVMVISAGIHRTDNGDANAMPGFGNALDDAQIAAVASYVRQNFGGMQSGAITADQVADIRSGAVPVGWIVRNAGALAIAGILVALLILVALIFYGLSRRRHRFA